MSYSYVCQYAGVRRAELEAEHRAAAGSVEGFVPQAKEPGAEAEVDFGPVSIVLDGEMAACHLFAYRLSYSGKAVHRVSALTLFPRGFDQVIPQVLAVLLFYLPLVFPVGTTRAGLLFGR